MQHETLQKLQEIQNRTGHVLVVEDFEAIARLDLLAAKVSDPTSGIDSPLTEHAVYIKNVPVYPVTLSHLQYIDEASVLLPDMEDNRTLVALWVSTLEYISDDHYEPKHAYRLFRAWAKRSRWTEADMQAVIALRFSKFTDNQDDSESENTGALIGFLVKEYGSTPKYWMNEAPISVIEAVVSDWQRRQNAQAVAHSRSAGGKATPPAPTPKYEAMKNFRIAAELLEQKWQKSHS